MPPLVVNTAPLVPVCSTWLQQHVELVNCDHRQEQELHAQLPRAEGLIIGSYLKVNDQLLDHAPHLKVVGRSGVGLETIDMEACQKRGIQVVYTPEANRQAVVEYVFALMLDAFRPRTSIVGPIETDRYLELRRTELGQQLDQLTLGILGLGRIGKRVGAVAHTIGMNLVVHDLLPEKQLRKEVDYPFEFVNMETLCRQSSVLTIHVDGRSENRHLIGTKQLALLQPGCLLINAARGMIIDTAALAQWARETADLNSRVILDVLDPEPPVDDCPLFGLPNVRLLPHLASRTHTGLENMSWVVRDIWAVLQGNKPQFPA